MDRRIIAGFDQQSAAVDAARELMSRELNPEDISLLSSNRPSPPQYVILDPDGKNIAANRTSLAGFDTVDFSPEADVIEINPGESVLVAGPLSGVMATIPEAGISGALINYGIDAESSHHLAQRVYEGKTLLVTRAGDDQIGEISSILNNHGGKDITRYFETNDGIG